MMRVDSRFFSYPKSIFPISLRKRRKKLKCFTEEAHRSEISASESWAKEFSGEKEEKENFSSGDGNDENDEKTWEHALMKRDIYTHIIIIMDEVIIHKEKILKMRKLFNWSL